MTPTIYSKPARERKGRRDIREKENGRNGTQLPDFAWKMLSSPSIGGPNREEGTMDAYAPGIERMMKRLFTR